VHLLVTEYSLMSEQESAIIKRIMNYTSVLRCIRMALNANVKFGLISAQMMFQDLKQF
jgi:hypothetical protein